MKLGPLFCSFPLFLATASLVSGCAASADPTTSSADSNDTEAATVHFASGAWDPSWSGPVRAGGHLRVDYDFDRLTACRNQSRVVSWVMNVSWRFDGGAITTAALDGSPGASETLPSAGIEIPADARSIELWFENKAVGGYDHCDAYDSKFGANYTRDVSP